MKIYKDIDTALTAALNAFSTAKTKEPYNEQYQNTTTEQAAPYPALYWEILEPLNWTDGSNGYLQAGVRLRIHCVVYDITTSRDRLFDFSEAVFQKLSLSILTAGGMDLSSNLTLVNTSLPKRYGNLKVMTHDYACEIFNLSSLPQGQTFDPGPFSLTINP